MGKDNEKTAEKGKKPYDDSKNLIAEGKALVQAFTSGGRFKFLAAKLKEKHDKDLLTEILK